MNSGPSQPPSGRKPFLLCAGVLALILTLLFFKAFLPGYVVFSNDGPLGGMMAAQNQVPEILSGLWVDLNWVGFPYPSPVVSVSTVLRLVTSPVLWAKIYPAFSLFFVGICAWFCFRQFRFSPIACLLGGLAATLNSDFFATACWGVASQPIAFGCAYLAIAALADTTASKRWLRVMLAGFATGMTVVESYDIGALFSLAIAGFVVFQALLEEGSIVTKLTTGCARAAVVAVCAALLAAGSMATVIGTQIKGVVGMEQDAETKAQRWAEATLASLPKKETLGIMVPGLFGFRGDTPNGGAYWGTAGSDPAWDAFLASDRKGAPPNGPLHGGMGSNYAGALVVLGIVWALVQSLRGQNSPLTARQRKQVWFFSAVALLAMLMMFGRFAPFYQLFYALPYASTIRNPAKFLHVLEWALVLLFGFGMHALATGYLDKAVTSTRGLMDHWRAWWKHVPDFERKWVLGSLCGLAAGVVGWLVYASMRRDNEAAMAELTRLTSRMQVSAADAADYARQTMSFSLGQVAWAVLFFALSVGLVLLIVSGYFAGRRAKVAGFLLVGLLALDLGWQNRPWIIIWNWQEKYVQAADNPVIAHLRAHGFAARVSSSPPWLPSAFRVAPQVAQAQGMLQSIYGTEWMQQIFQFYNIPCLDVIQMPRRPVEYEAFQQALQFGYNTNTLHAPVRHWELTSTRFLLTTAPLVEAMNQGLDGNRGRFQIRMLFEYFQDRNGGPILTRTNTTGPYALVEFTGALPRVSLYTDWQVATPDPERNKAFVAMMRQQLPPFMTSAFDLVDAKELATLERLASKPFNPAQTVLLAEPLAQTPPTNATPGTVSFVSYAPKHIVLKARVDSASVLLLNDKYDANWQVLVDGQPARLLRCNYVMRGVQLAPGEHTVEFHFRPPVKYTYVSFAAVVAALLLWGYVAASGRRGTGPTTPTTIANK